MSEHTIIGVGTRTSVGWDLGVGLVHVVADEVTPEDASLPDVQVSFSSRVWISLDRSGRPVDLDILDVPPILVGVVPPARRADPPANASQGSIPWLLDTESNWIWMELIQGPAEQRLERAGRVELRLVGSRATRLRLRVPVAGMPGRTDRIRS
ncbi:hypothetical protein [Streptomyces sp. NRRL S-646]|uniref:hypothetical protein n=1 Tax=Streptomyces sp. NRRL S-646 TaxID=1463917 RepID=UPI0004CC35B2|nr:hypothetical protein [Streptomyces sp. NRRL S-646]